MLTPSPARAPGGYIPVAPQGSPIRFGTQNSPLSKNNGKNDKLSSMKKNLMASLAANPSPTRITRAPAAAVVPEEEVEENPNVAKALELLKGNRNPNKKVKRRVTPMEMWEESDRNKPAATKNQDEDDVIMAGTETAPGGEDVNDAQREYEHISNENGGVRQDDEHMDEDGTGSSKAMSEMSLNGSSPRNQDVL